MLTVSDNEEDDDNADFFMFDPELIDLHHGSDNNLSPNVSVAATSQQTILLPNVRRMASLLPVNEIILP